MSQHLEDDQIRRWRRELEKARAVYNQADNLPGMFKKAAKEQFGAMVKDLERKIEQRMKMLQMKEDQRLERIGARERLFSGRRETLAAVAGDPNPAPGQFQWEPPILRSMRRLYRGMKMSEGGGTRRPSASVPGLLRSSLPTLGIMK